jgi:hypothetical protein
MTDSNGAYHHTQIGWVLLVAYAVGMVIIALGYRSAISTVPPGGKQTAVIGLVAAVAVLVTVVTFLFSSLTIDVRHAELRWHMTAGLLHGRVPLRDVEQVMQVRHPAIYGWGYRLTPDGALYRVSGVRAVKIRMRDGRVLNFGSDEPERLAQAIERAVASR